MVPVQLDLPDSQKVLVYFYRSVFFFSFSFQHSERETYVKISPVFNLAFADGRKAIDFSSCEIFI